MDVYLKLLELSTEIWFFNVHFYNIYNIVHSNFNRTIIKTNYIIMHHIHYNHIHYNALIHFLNLCFFSLKEEVEEEKSSKHTKQFLVSKYSFLTIDCFPKTPPSAIGWIPIPKLTAFSMCYVGLVGIKGSRFDWLTEPH